MFVFYLCLSHLFFARFKPLTSSLCSWILSHRLHSNLESLTLPAKSTPPQTPWPHLLIKACRTCRPRRLWVARVVDVSQLLPLQEAGLGGSMPVVDSHRLDSNLGWEASLSSRRLGGRPIQRSANRSSSNWCCFSTRTSASGENRSRTWVETTLPVPSHIVGP